MRKRIWSGTCAAITLGLVAGLAAQNPPPTPQTTSPASAQKDTASKSITVTGCVQKAAEGATGTSGSTASRGTSETKFLLTSAAMGATGTAGTAPSTAVASEYRLDADDAKLTPHVGHKVEIAGTVDQASAPSSQPPTASAANAPKLKVDSVKMIAATCP